MYISTSLNNEILYYLNGHVCNGCGMFWFLSEFMLFFLLRGSRPTLWASGPNFWATKFLGEWSENSDRGSKSSLVQIFGVKILNIYYFHRFQFVSTQFEEFR